MLSSRLMVPEIEGILKHVPCADRAGYRFIIKNKILKYNKKNRKGDNNDNEMRSNLRDLKKDNDINILAADKSDQLVILDRQEFLLKADLAIQNLNAECIPNDPTKTILGRIDQVKKLDLPDDLKKACKHPVNSHTPNLFFRIKTHKVNLPFRPIVAKFSAPTFIIEKALENFLMSYLPHSEITIKSSLDALQKLKNVGVISHITELYSLDVVSMFPSIPLRKTTDIIMGIMSRVSNFSIKQLEAIETLLNLVNSSNYFGFQNKIYKQKDGTGMGSPISGILADFLLYDFEMNHFNKAILKPSLTMRYVDDFLIIWDHGNDNFNIFKDFLNSYHQNIKFTSEKEMDGSINFLDIHIVRNNQRNLEFSVFRKDMSQGCFIPKDSLHPIAHKKSAIRANIKRAYRYCSNSDILKREINFIKKNAAKFGYNDDFVNEIIYEQVAKFSTSLSNDNENENRKFFIPIHYIPELMPIIKNISRKFKINLAYRNFPSVEALIKSDRSYIPSNAGVYEIPLQVDNSDIVYYIGKTIRNLEKRKQEHMSNIIKDDRNSELVKFVMENDALPLWDRARIIFTPIASDYEIYESLEIIKRKDRDIINKVLSRDIDITWFEFIKKY